MDRLMYVWLDDTGILEESPDYIWLFVFSPSYQGKRVKAGRREKQETKGTHVQKLRGELKSRLDWG